MKKGEFGNVSLNMMEMFINAAEYGSFSEAARAMFVDQSAISRNVKALENSLGVKVFRRTNQGCILTEEGERFYLLFLKFINEVDSTLTDIRLNSPKSTERIIRIGILHSPHAAEVFEKLQREYRQRRPDITFHSVVMDYNELRRGLVCKELDCIITYSLGFGRLVNVETKRLTRLDTHFAVPASNPMVRADAFDPAGLDGEPLFIVALPELEVAERRALSICNRFHIEPRIEYMATRLDVEAAIKSGRGFSIDSNEIARHYPEDIRLYRIPNPGIEQYTLLCWNKADCTEQCREFAEWVTPEF